MPPPSIALLHTNTIMRQGITHELRIELRPCPYIKLCDIGREKLLVGEEVVISIQTTIEVANQLAHLQFLGHLSHSFFQLATDALSTELQHTTIVFVLYPRKEPIGQDKRHDDDPDDPLLHKRVGNEGGRTLKCL